LNENLLEKVDLTKYLIAKKSWLEPSGDMTQVFEVDGAVQIQFN